MWAVYLHYEVRRVVQQHHKSTNSDKVGAVGEADEAYGGDVMNHLLLEVLYHTDSVSTRKSVRDLYLSFSSYKSAEFF